MADGRVVKLDELVHLDQGIAVTSHASQGKTVDSVIVSAPVSAFAQGIHVSFHGLQGCAPGSGVSAK